MTGSSGKLFDEIRRGGWAHETACKRLADCLETPMSSRARVMSDVGNLDDLDVIAVGLEDLSSGWATRKSEPHEQGRNVLRREHIKCIPVRLLQSGNEARTCRWCNHVGSNAI